VAAARGSSAHQCRLNAHLGIARGGIGARVGVAYRHQRSSALSASALAQRSASWRHRLNASRRRRSLIARRGGSAALVSALGGAALEALGARQRIIISSALGAHLGGSS